jgi:CO/xanthine dehydrogenase Mo-binding subunit
VAKLLVKGEIPPRLEREFTVVGKPIDRIDGVEKALGEAQYAGDLKLSGMLYGKILRSPHAHARIVKIDTNEAEKLPGVRAIISRNNFADWQIFWYNIGRPAFPQEMGYYGQEVAAVAADTIQIADRAVKLIKVEYEVLPAVFDVEEAIKLDAPSVPVIDKPSETLEILGEKFQNFRGPVSAPVANKFDGKSYVLKRGDADQGFKDADVTVEGNFTTNFQFHASMQTRSCVSHYQNGSLTVYDSSQGPWQVREDLARSLIMPMEKVRIQVKYMGGGFGSKAGAQSFLHYASRLSMLTSRPVRMELTRPEEFMAHPHRQSSKSWIKIGAKKDGTFTAIKARILVNVGVGGAYQREKAVEHSFELYSCPNCYVEQIGVYTNTPTTGYMRSVLRVVGNFPLECLVDDLAKKLNMDPVQLRLKNYTVYGNQSDKIRYSAKNLDKCIEKVVKESNWEDKRSLYSIENSNGSPVKKGIGLATYLYEGVGQPPYNAKAKVYVDRDGTATILGGFVDIGGGQATMAKMLVSEELGLKLEQVKVKWGDTEGTEYSPGTHGSRLTSEIGPALVQAAYLVRKQIFAIARKIPRMENQDLFSASGIIRSKSNPEISVTFEEVCRLLPEGQRIEAVGSRAPNPKGVAFKTFGAQVAEVEVDVQTGAVRVLRITSAHELGRALNPKMCDSQQYGAICMGLGFALYENPVFDVKTGIMLNTDLHQYRMASSLDVPEIVPFNIEAEDPYYAYFAKGVGEAPLVGVPAAVRNAILHATGTGLYSTPMTPDTLASAL